DRLRLAAFLGALAGIGAGGVDEGDDRKAETVGEIHEADRLAVAFGPGHAEVALDPAAGVVALLLAEDDDRPATEPREPAHDREVVREIAVARERRPFGEEGVHVVLAMRPVRMAGDLAFPPRIE